MRRALAALGLLLVMALPAYAQLAAGSIYGTVNDESGAALPGVTVTAKSAGSSVSTTSGSDGHFRFLNLAPGSYTVSALLKGFSTVNRDNVIVAVGANVDIPISLKVASVEETITVTAESPVLDTKKTGTATNFTQDELSKVPNSRDPWALLRTVPGMVMDRVNIAGNESGQQSAFRAKGASGNDAVWNLDGVSITDMAAIGASPTYFDYDAFQEIQISTSGNDIKQPTGGVGLNFVTKRGTNSFHGNVHGYFTHDDLEGENVPGELANLAPQYVANGTKPTTPETANHNKQIADYGFDLGGPIVRDKLWFWGSYGKQDIRLLRSAGALIDKTLLKDMNAKLNWQASSRDMVSALFFNGAKEKFGRGTGNCAGCVEADGATWNQGDSTPTGGPPGFWKIEDNHIFSPNFFMTAKYAYYGQGFSLTPRGGLDMQSGQSVRLGQTFGSAQFQDNQRPQHTANLDVNYFKAAMGGNHEFKLGLGYRRTSALTNTIWPGDMVVAYDNSATNQRARIYRQGLGINKTWYWSGYVGDAFTKDRLTLNLGVRYDYQTGRAAASSIQGNPSFPSLVPGITFDGYDAPFAWKDIAPRLGLTYALDASRKTLVRAGFARYATQLDTGTVGYANPSGTVGWIEMPWTDLNGDHLVQRNEVTLQPTPLATSAGFNASAAVSANQIAADLKAPLTTEAVFGVDRELMPELAVSLSYTHRRFTRFVTTPRVGFTLADYAPGTPVTGTIPGGAAYSIPIFIPNQAKALASANGRIEMNDPDYAQTFNGIEFAATKRLSNKWMARVAAGWNDHVESWGTVPVTINNAAGNPTRLDTDALSDGGQVAPRSAGSGNGDIFINAKWSLNAYALYQMPYGLEVAANVFAKQGTPFPYFRSTSLGQDGTQRVMITSTVDSVRFANLFNLDLRLAKNIKATGVTATVTADVFNLLNNNTELNRNRSLPAPPTTPLAPGAVQATSFGLLTDYLSPRILRLGVRLGF